MTDASEPMGARSDLREPLLGDGTVVSTLTSSLFLAFAIVYLVMVVLFQSWAYPVVIMVSVPLCEGRETCCRTEEA